MITFGVFKQSYPIKKDLPVDIQPQQPLQNEVKPVVQKEVKPASQNKNIVEAFNKINISEKEGGNINYKTISNGKKKFDKFISLKL
jgi:hypothetical protein